MNNRSRQIVKALLNARSNIRVRMETKPNKYGVIWATFVDKRKIRYHIKLGFTILKPPRDYIDAYGELWIAHGESV